jgi:hypothetical protein
VGLQRLQKVTKGYKRLEDQNRKCNLIYDYSHAILTRSDSGGLTLYDKVTKLQKLQLQSGFKVFSLYKCVV